MTGIGNIGNIGNIEKHPEITQRKTNRGRRGFTLIEIIVVIVIISILTSIGLYVGDKMLNASKTKETTANMQIIMHAVEIYNEEVGELSSSSLNGTELFTALRDGGYTSGTPAHDAYQADVWDAKLRSIIEKLPDSALAKNASGKATGFQDSFDVPLVFEPDTGLGGRPRLVSSGPDKKTGTPEEKEDDIISDK